MVPINYKRSLFFALLVSSLTTEIRSQETWTKEMEIHTYNGGGKRPESKTVMIKNSFGTFIQERQGKKDTLRFSLSREELNGLLTSINANHFREIKSGITSYTAYDKPTTAIIFKWGSNKHEVSIGAKEAIIKGNAADFNKLYNYILALVAKKTGV